MAEKIDVFAQNSIRIRTENGNIYVDPFRIPKDFNDAKVIFITHDHYDHFSPEDIAKVVCKESILVVPKNMEDKAKEVEGQVREIKTVKPDESYELDGIKFETVPSYNNTKSFHPKNAGWIGYIFIIEGERIYVAGDMDATDEAKAVKCDIALVPIGGTYTMNAKEAADFINEIKPRVAIPVHYGSIVGSASDGDVFAGAVDSSIEVVKKIEF